MMMHPNPNLHQYEAEADRKMKAQERKRDLSLLRRDVTNTVERNRISSQAAALIGLIVVLLLIVGLVVLYHFIH